jgi:hypothetical protein
MLQMLLETTSAVTPRRGLRDQRHNEAAPNQGVPPARTPAALLVFIRTIR